MAIHHLVPRWYCYTYGPSEPALRVRSGDRVVAETRDAMGLDAQGNPMPDEMKQRVPGTQLKESVPDCLLLVCVEAVPLHDFMGETLAAPTDEVTISG